MLASLRPVTPFAFCFAVLFCPAEARAEQFVLFDETFTYTWEDAINATPSKSHYYVTEGSGLSVDRPDDWQSPVNYRDGSVHVRIDVIDKPEGGEPGGWALCYVGNAGSYGCPYTPYYTAPGVYEQDVDMHSFYNNETIDWSQGIKQVDLVYTINDSGSGHVHNFPEKQALTTPTTVRITMVQVSQGDTYDPSILDTGMGGGGGSGGSGGAAGSSGAGGLSGGGGMGGMPASGGASGSAPVAPPPGGSGGAGGGAGSGGSGSAPRPASAPGTGCTVSVGAANPGFGAWLLLAGFGMARRLRRRR